MKKINKLYFFGVLLYIAVVSSFLTYNHFDFGFNVNDEINDLKIHNCPNFNGKSFLLSGGSSKPQNHEELNYELQRLNWLCSGGRIN